VNIVYFNAKMLNNKVLLEWATASETNNNYFEIQRSTDAIHFTTISKVNGAGNSNSIINYQYVDDINDLENKIYYYRLNQVDFDGANEYSDIISIEVLRNSDSYIRIGNSENNIVLLFSSNISGNYNIMVFDNSGRLAIEQHESINNSNIIKINKQSLNNGLYSIIINHEDEIVTKKVVIVR